jgi:acylphosphatase
MQTSQARRVLYSGRVQGVGFRYRARRIANGYAVTGFVRNLPDGRVELVVEGAPPDLDRLLAEISAAMADYIGHVDVQTGPATGIYETFDIAF